LGFCLWTAELLETSEETLVREMKEELNEEGIKVAKECFG
jgi:hypothetical protein